MSCTASTTILDLWHGELRVRGWPLGLRPPHGIRSVGAELRGLPRFRWRLLATLESAGVPFLDQVMSPDQEDRGGMDTAAGRSLMLATWLTQRGRGIAVGLCEVERFELVVSALCHLRTRALLVVRDSGARFVWSDALVSRYARQAAPVVTLADGARTMSWRVRQHDLLVIDRPEQMPGSMLEEVLNGSAARYQVAFVDDLRQHRWLHQRASWGPVLAIADPLPGPRRLELRLPLTAEERGAYEEAWDTFFCAFDRFLALRPGIGFGGFVQQAREDPGQRGALLAWHRAGQIAAWNEAKAGAVGALLTRHRGERILVFTPDRASAYSLARSHLIAAVTAELRPRERSGLLADFVAGRLRVLAGPRLLDLGVPEGCATVGILVGGGFGSSQRIARSRRVRSDGVIYELVAQDTGEVGRARRFARADATEAAVHHPHVR